MNQSIVVLDFETTGLHAELGDRVTELAAVRMQRGKIVERYETLVNCGVRIPRHIVKFTHINQEMVDGAPAPAEVFPRLLQFIGNDPVFAHNAAFDQSFLECEGRRLGLIVGSHDFICSVKLARVLFPDLRSHALGPLACSLGLHSMAAAHRAGPDVDMTANVLSRMFDIIRSRYVLPYLNIEAIKHLVYGPVASAA